MLPLILSSQNQADTDLFLDTYIRKNSISPFQIYRYEPEKKELSIDQIRQVKQEVVTRPKERRLFILSSFDTASLEAQNALLKTLEEKTVGNQFILIVKNSDQVLPTLRSRSRLLSLVDTRTSDSSDSKKYDSFFDSVNEGNNVAFLGNSLIQSITREGAVELLDAAMHYLRLQYQISPKTTHIMKKALLTKELLQNNNTNPQLSLDSFLIFWSRQK